MSSRSTPPATAVWTTPATFANGPPTPRSGTATRSSSSTKPTWSRRPDSTPCSRSSKNRRNTSSSSSPPRSRTRSSAPSAPARTTTPSGWCRRSLLWPIWSCSAPRRTSPWRPASSRSSSARAGVRCATPSPCWTSSWPAPDLTAWTTNSRSPCWATRTPPSWTTSSRPSPRRIPPRYSALWTGSSRPGTIPGASSKTCWSGSATSSSSRQCPKAPSPSSAACRRTRSPACRTRRTTSGRPSSPAPRTSPTPRSRT